MIQQSVNCTVDHALVWSAGRHRRFAQLHLAETWEVRWRQRPEASFSET